MHLLWRWPILLNFPSGSISSLNLPYVEIIWSGQCCDYCNGYWSFEWLVIFTQIRLTVRELSEEGFCDSPQDDPWSLVPGTPPHSPWSLDLRTLPHSPADQKALLALGIPLVPWNSGVLYWSKGHQGLYLFFGLLQLLLQRLLHRLPNLRCWVLNQSFFYRTFICAIIQFHYCKISVTVKDSRFLFSAILTLSRAFAIFSIEGNASTLSRNK